uniref:Actin-related protein 2/3 complex subunit n=1 Tax=Halisarca dujardinii TaxID=2583056 RepID=A0A9E9FX85_HALDU|nr:ARPC1B [Halisarca dujardinii]
MSTFEDHPLVEGPITCHCWNGDRTKFAICPNNNEVHIYSKGKTGKWEMEQTLTEHSQRVLGIDWAPKSNQLVTCGADRNAYVWTFDPKEGAKGSWKPSLVILRINRAATCVKWSPLENKFAVGCGDRCISICYFDVDNDWWVSKHIKKPIKSTVLSIDWHPNNYLVACGSADFKARVFSGYMKEIEDKPESTPWGKKMSCGQLMAEKSNGRGGWVHGVSFSPSGNKLAWVGHDSTVSVLNQLTDVVSTIRTKDLPYLACMFVSDNSLIVAGHDCQPLMYNHDDKDCLSLIDTLNKGKKQKSQASFSAMEKFKGLDKRAEEKAGGTDLNTVHQNAITAISIVTGERGSVKSFATSGVDGHMVVWNCKSLETAIAGLKF